MWRPSFPSEKNESHVGLTHENRAEHFTSGLAAVTWDSSSQRKQRGPPQTYSVVLGTTTGRLTQGRDWASLLLQKLSSAVLGLRCCMRAFSRCGEQAFSPVKVGAVAQRWGLLSSWSVGSRTQTVALVCGLRCLLACGLSPPGIEPMSPALVGRFLTTGPPGKSWASLLLLSKEECWMLGKHFSF